MTKPQLRCAIYTRKSSEEGLEQDFNSLDAQREACEAYIKSQANEGWRLIKTKFDDGGYSGGNIERPGLEALLAAVDEGKVDIIVVYKVDRLTRSLADFAKIIERLDAKKTSFVSVTQSFNTTTSMGRLTLNVLLSFAQFEREVTGERIRDKLAASKKKGLWMGGNIPLGYDVDGRTLRINAKEGKTVELIFKRYVELKSADALVAELEDRGIKSKAWTSSRGNKMGDAAICRGALLHLLRNPLYLGQIRHKDKTYPGKHKAIISKELWDEVQLVIAGNRNSRAGKKVRAKEEFWLTGRIFDAVGRSMTPIYTARPGGKRYKYYAVNRLLHPKQKVEPAIVRLQMQFTHDLVQAAVARKFGMDDTDTLTRGCISKVTVEHNCIRIEAAVTSEGKARSLVGAIESKADTDGLVEIELPVRVSKHGQKSEIIPPDNLRAAPPSNPRILNALRQAWQWRQMIESGKYASADVLAEAEGVSKRRVNKSLHLAFMLPAIVASHSIRAG